jgi:hypothetical protein
MKEQEFHNDWIIDTLTNRTVDTRQTITTLRNFPEIWKKAAICFFASTGYPNRP